MKLYVIITGLAAGLFLLTILLMLIASIIYAVINVKEERFKEYEKSIEELKSEKERWEGECACLEARVKGYQRDIEIYRKVLIHAGLDVDLCHESGTNKEKGEGFENDENADGRERTENRGNENV